MPIEKHQVTTEQVKAIRRAAVAFANDYGPLPAANSGDEGAAHEIATRLLRKLEREGLRIVYSPKPSPPNHPERMAQ